MENKFFLQILTDNNVYLHKGFEDTIIEDFKLAKGNNPKITKEYIDVTMNLIFSQYGIKYFNDVDELLNSDLEFCCISSMSFDEEKLNYGREFVKNFKNYPLLYPISITLKWFQGMRLRVMHLNILQNI
ncbi:hypothetical protein [Caloramator sp. mosi_1]|uniref:hypothetical protein n=1 Tax=Caloramator sp. mosi_1 TaxID=3023090 RepID=UPI0030816A09